MNWLAKLLFERKLKSFERTVVVSNFKTAKKALVLYNANDKVIEEQIREFSKFTTSQSIKTTVLGYQSKKNNQVEKTVKEGHLYFDKSGVNWMGASKNDVIKELVDVEFDLLFDFNNECVFPLRYISSLSKAKFKISWATAYQQKVCDLTFEIKENNIKNLIEQIKHYLPMIN